MSLDGVTSDDRMVESKIYRIAIASNADNV